MRNKIQELKDKISPKALKVLKGTGYENDEEILIDLAELTEWHQIKASEYLTVSERGKMEAIKKKNEEEWRRRQLTLEYFQIPEEVKYELAKLENITVKNIEKIVKAKELKEKYPDKDKNQIKFQLTDEDLEKAQKLVKMYNRRSVPDLARKMIENYLKRCFEIEQLEAIKNNIR